MGWFDEQIREREKYDDEMFSQAAAGIADAVSGLKTSLFFQSDFGKTQSAVDELLAYYHVKPVEVPKEIQGFEERLDYQLRPYGMMYRSVILEKGWSRNASGVMLGVKKEDNTAAALIPHSISGYRYYDSESGKRVRVTLKTEELFGKEAIVVYPSFPLKSMGLSDLYSYIFRLFSASDAVFTAVLALTAALLGLLTPKLTNMIVGSAAESGSTALLLSVAFFMACVMISVRFISSAQEIAAKKIGAKIKLGIQSAVMMRILSLPAAFFRSYSSGELAGMVQLTETIGEMLVSVLFTSGLTAVCSLVYIPQIYTYAPALMLPAFLVILVITVFSAVSSFAKMRMKKKQLKYALKESGISYALISGIQKVRISGAEKRAFVRWSEQYSKRAAVEYRPPLIVRYNTAITTAVLLVGSIFIYYLSLKSNMSAAQYYAFNTAYGMLTGAFTVLSENMLTAADIQSSLELLSPVLGEAPEVSDSQHSVTRLSGGIELNNVTFQYGSDMPLILDNLSLKIRPGEYVAVVGPTGCGKSTLMRIMLGMEKPRKGAVYYDGRDLSSIDPKSLRGRIGVVLQNGKLFQGDIYSNIAISAPGLTLEKAWEAAELAGIAEDIRRMPMGMNTMISEGQGGISGGQKQRLMIARAIAAKPKILMFDEATSALDNLTQKNVSEALDGLKCTRIVIAHRLSTILHCDRILYLENGKIAEEGSYSELIEKNGKFARLVERQQTERK
ncbi:MAG: ATP-binding cassette domain-containing protein [Eubacterium sp.]|nr:ATP-binding cassette domain-containing protein [Eubacterium sp.]